MRLGFAKMDFARFDRAEEPHEQVEEVDADVGRNAAGLLLGALPRNVVPAAAAGHVGQDDLVPGAGGLGVESRLDREQGGVDAELEDCEYPPSGLGFELFERVEVPRVDDQRLLADRVGAVSQRQAHVRVVEVVGRADADPVDALGLGTAAQLVEVAVETLDLLEEAHVEAVRVEDADRVMGIGRRDKAVAGVADRLKVARGDVAARHR